MTFEAMTDIAKTMRPLARRACFVIGRPEVVVRSTAAMAPASGC